MNKITLSIPDRLQLPGLLPKSGKLIEMELTASIKEKIRFTPQEIEEFELADLPDGRVAWKLSKAKDREFQFEDSQIEMVQKGIKLADEQEAITEENYPLAKKMLAIKIRLKKK